MHRCNSYSTVMGQCHSSFYKGRNGPNVNSGSLLNKTSTEEAISTNDIFTRISASHRTPKWVSAKIYLRRYTMPKNGKQGLFNKIWTPGEILTNDITLYPWSHPSIQMPKITKWVQSIKYESMEWFSPMAFAVHWALNNCSYVELSFFPVEKIKPDISWSVVIWWSKLVRRNQIWQDHAVSCLCHC